MFVDHIVTYSDAVGGPRVADVSILSGIAVPVMAIASGALGAVKSVARITLKKNSKVNSA